jgi:hypothetical protein
VGERGWLGGLFMFALVAIQRDEAVRGLDDRRVIRGESNMKASHGVSKSDTDFQASKRLPSTVNTGIT